MESEHPDAPKQFGIRLSQETVDLISEIQEFRRRTNQPITLSKRCRSEVWRHEKVLENLKFAETAR